MDFILFLFYFLSESNCTSSGSCKFDQKGELSAEWVCRRVMGKNKIISCSIFLEVSPRIYTYLGGEEPDDEQVPVPNYHWFMFSILPKPELGFDLLYPKGF